MTQSQTVTKIAIFQKKEIRKILHKDEWWFSAIDVIEALSGTDRPRKYWSDLKKKLVSEGYTEVSEKIGQLKMSAPDGKLRETDCANTETMFRIIQTIKTRTKKWQEDFNERKLSLQATRQKEIAPIAYVVTF